MRAHQKQSSKGSDPRREDTQQILLLFWCRFCSRGRAVSQRDGSLRFLTSIAARTRSSFSISTRTISTRSTTSTSTRSCGHTRIGSATSRTTLAYQTKCGKGDGDQTDSTNRNGNPTSVLSQTGNKRHDRNQEANQSHPFMKRFISHKAEPQCREVGKHERHRRTVNGTSNGSHNP